MLEAIHRGETITVVSRVYGIPQRTIFDWLARYRAQGWDGLKEGKRSGRPSKLTPQTMRWLYDAITHKDPMQYKLPFCLWTLAIIRTMLKKQKGIALSKSAISRLLGQLGLSPQRPLYRSYKQDPEALEHYLQTTFKEVKRKAKRNGATIYFIDEAALRSDHHGGTTWGAIGDTPIVQDSGDRFGIKMISAVSSRGDLRFSVIEGRMNSDRFIVFLKNLHSDSGKPIIVIADNAPYHKSAKVKCYAKNTKGGVTLFYLPRYTPELNPDEQVWNHLKRKIGQKYIDSKQQLKKEAVNILRSFQRRIALVQSFFQLKMTKYAAHC